MISPKHNWKFHAAWMMLFVIFSPLSVGVAAEQDTVGWIAFYAYIGGGLAVGALWEFVEFAKALERERD